MLILLLHTSSEAPPPTYGLVTFQAGSVRLRRAGFTSITLEYE